MASAERPALRALARRLGVEDGYESALDGRHVATSDATREALVSAMGHDASSEHAAEAAREALGEEPPPGGDPSASCLPFRDVLGDAKVFGIWTNLYSVRSRRNLGFGNLGDLRALVLRAAAEGAAFVGLNPLHVLANRSGAICPYAPVSRRFRNPLYLDPELVPELADCGEARSLLASRGEAIRALRAADVLEPRAVEELLFAVLRPLHDRFLRATSPAARARRRAYRRYRDAHDPRLSDFATFQALARHHEAAGGARDFRTWPPGQRAPDTSFVRGFAARAAREIAFHAWLQFELDRQLESVAEAARGAGMAVGLYADLALGSEAGGFDPWAEPGLFARGVSVGAPPDAFSRAGQDWGFPPLDPHALRRDGFAHWRELLDANLHAAGALRIDHALGLRRLFWIPEGRPPSEGAYVRYPEAELLAELARASRAHGALVIGEDLGTVPEGFSEEIRRRGLLSSRVLLFERDAHGFRPSYAWPEACLATVNTHDLPPLRAWLGGEDLRLRRDTGQIPDDESARALAEERRADRDALRARLAEEACLAGDAAPGDDAAWAEGMTRFLCRTPAALVGLSLDDLAGEREPINLPGVSSARHPSWVRRMGLPLEELFDAPRARRTLAAVPEARRGRR